MKMRRLWMSLWDLFAPTGIQALQAEIKVLRAELDAVWAHNKELSDALDMAINSLASNSIEYGVKITPPASKL